MIFVLLSIVLQSPINRFALLCCCLLFPAINNNNLINLINNFVNENNELNVNIISDRCVMRQRYKLLL